MIQITIPECLRKAATAKIKVIINSDDIWAFTEQPEKNEKAGNASQKAHDLFDLFTANIIRKETSIYQVTGHYQL